MEGSNDAKSITYRAEKKMTNTRESAALTIFPFPEREKMAVGRGAAVSNA